MDTQRPDVVESGARLGLIVAAVMAATLMQTLDFIKPPGVSGDDWEPAMVADKQGHLYVAFAHAVVARERRGTYHTRLLVQRSDDGVHWNAPIAVAPPAPKGSEGQFDPWFTLAPDGRSLSLGFLQGYPHAPVEVVTSRNLGQSWSAPIGVSSLPPLLDKVVLALRGALMAVAYTDYHAHVIASVSTNQGTTWSTHVIATIHGLTDSSQMLVSGGSIDSKRNIFFTWDATWSSHHRPAPAAVWITRSGDRGASWTTTTIGYSGLPPRCRQCQDREFFAAQLTMAVGTDDRLYLLWNATSPSEKNGNGAPERVYLVSSSDRGHTFSEPREVSDAPTSAAHCFPAIATGPLPGDVRVAWMDTRSGEWNAYYRASRDGGLTFEPTVRLSSGRAVDFGVPYGDYMQLAVDRAGLTHAAWGEDDNQANPGNIWIANQIR